MKLKETLKNQNISAIQNRHFWMFDVSNVVLVLILLPIALKFNYTTFDFLLFAFMWFLSSVGVELGYHRYFSHNSFKTNKYVESLLAILGTLSAQGPSVTWAATHRHHHKYSDKEGDSHSPHVNPQNNQSKLYRFFHAHLLWKYEYAFPNPFLFTRTLTKNSRLKTITKYYYLWVALGVIVPTIVSGIYFGTWTGAFKGFYLAGLFRISFCQHLTWSINSITHLVGTKPNKTTDHSRNIGPLFLLTLGGSWHNNHHAYPSSASNQRKFWQLDPGYWLILALEKLGLVWDVNKVECENQLKNIPVASI